MVDFGVNVNVKRLKSSNIDWDDQVLFDEEKRDDDFDFMRRREHNFVLIEETRKLQVLMEEERKYEVLMKKRMIIELKSK